MPRTTRILFIVARSDQARDGANSRANRLDEKVLHRAAQRGRYVAGRCGGSTVRSCPLRTAIKALHHPINVDRACARAARLIRRAHVPEERRALLARRRVLTLLRRAVDGIRLRRAAAERQRLRQGSREDLARRARRLAEACVLAQRVEAPALPPSEVPVDMAAMAAAEAELQAASQQALPEDDDEEI